MILVGRQERVGLDEGALAEVVAGAMVGRQLEFYVSRGGEEESVREMVEVVREQRCVANSPTRPA